MAELLDRLDSDGAAAPGAAEAARFRTVPLAFGVMTGSLSLRSAMTRLALAVAER